MSTHTLTIEEFTDQLAQYGMDFFAPRYDAQVIIRDANRDYGIAAVHMDKEKGTLIFDLGGKLED
jgi:hypothetical protein